MDLVGILDRIDMRSKHECWPWIGGKSRDRGRVRGTVYFRGTQRLAVRVVYFIVHGEWPEAILHTCDNPLCCNPDHLLAGTQLQNIADRDAKGRTCKGRRHPNFGKRDWRD